MDAISRTQWQTRVDCNCLTDASDGKRPVLRVTYDSPPRCPSRQSHPRPPSPARPASPPARRRWRRRRTRPWRASARGRQRAMTPPSRRSSPWPPDARGTSSGSSAERKGRETGHLREESATRAGHARTYARTHARAHARTHARTHTRTHARTHRTCSDGTTRLAKTEVPSLKSLANCTQ
eukprot:2753792-Pleurochrysis_carterae.AAC.2